MTKLHTAQIERLFEAITKIESEQECFDFFEDLCTIKEIQDMSQRFETAVMLKNGKSYTEITAEVGVSSATIGRVNKCLNYGTGGYESVISKLGDK